MKRRQFVTVLAGGTVGGVLGLPASGATAPGSRLLPGLGVSGPGRVVSERPFTLRTMLVAHRQLRAASVLLQLRDPAGGWNDVGRVHLPPDGRGRVRVEIWKSGTYRVHFAGSAALLPATSRPFTVTGVAGAPRVVAPRGAPEPHHPRPLGQRPEGIGANATVGPIPDQVWQRMQGVSWRRGAPVGRSQLRYVEVNFWGFDGYRYRGEVVLNAATATAAAGALTDLFHLGFPIRRMVLPDVFGRGRVLGADDYASMAADNTSGFNYRYVDGEERRRVLSPHAYGNAIDINTWENPYRGPTGVFPDSWYLDRSTPRGTARGLFLARSAATRTLTGRGFVWGASYGDSQHFQYPFRVRGALLPMAS